MRARISICSSFGLLLAASLVHAQATTPGTAAKPVPPAQTASKTSPAPKKPARPTVAPRGYISVNGGYEGTSNGFSSDWTYDYYADTGSATAQYPGKGSFIFDAGGGVRAWRDLMVGAALSRSSRTDTVSMTASVPHPFNFTFRDAQGSDTGLAHGETTLHLQAMWMLRPHGRLQVGLFGGPSIFSVQQTLVSSPQFNEIYPYDTVTISGANTKEHSATAVGFNAGSDVWYAVSRTAAVGVLLRFARGTASFEAPDKSAIEVHAGGLQVGGGIRIRILEPKKPGGKGPGKPEAKGKK